MEMRLNGPTKSDVFGSVGKFYFITALGVFLVVAVIFYGLYTVFTRDQSIFGNSSSIINDLSKAANREERRKIILDRVKADEPLEAEERSGVTEWLADPDRYGDLNLSADDELKLIELLRKS